MTTTAAQRQALGAYGERVAATHLTDQGMVVLDRNWRCDQGELDLVLRDGEVLVACEVKTRSSDVGGSPHEAVDDAKLQRLHRLLWRWCEDHDVRPGRDAGRPRRRAPRPPGRRRWSTTCGGSPDAVRDHSLRLARRCHRPPDRRPGRRLDRPGRHRARRPARPGAQRGPRPLPDGDHQQRLRLAATPGASRSCCRRPTCPSAAPTSTWRSRSRSSAPSTWCPRSRSRTPSSSAS